MGKPRLVSVQRSTVSCAARDAVCCTFFAPIAGFLEAFMKQFVAISGLVFIGAGAWYLGSRLSSDAIGMALGVMFGVLAGLPAALLVMAAHRRVRSYEEPDGGDSGRMARGNYAFPASPQPPVIIVTGQGFQQQGSAPQNYMPVDQSPRLALPDLSSQQSGRTYRMVGEKDEWVDEW